MKCNSNFLAISVYSGSLNLLVTVTNSTHAVKKLLFSMDSRISQWFVDAQNVYRKIIDNFLNCLTTRQLPTKRLEFGLFKRNLKFSGSRATNRIDNCWVFYASASQTKTTSCEWLWHICVCDNAVQVQQKEQSTTRPKNCATTRY